MGKNISFPVGKVQMLKMYPLNFAEYLLAMGEELLYEHLRSMSTDEKISAHIQANWKKHIVNT